ncbi:MAG: SusC/RagA family TonB-linked outer membrane protein [Prolixibacteraceae bacterium]|nr:SusC/RagA family TonB-linked outer membrane protein [Prolixibacteraceae bacterium]
MKKIALLLAFFAIGLQVLMAQTKEISGTVTSADDGGLIPGVSVSVKGTTLGTITDMDGAFRLKVPQDAKTLTFSFVGMASQDVAIGTQSTFKIKLSSENISVDEVVVTALGISRDKKSLGYSSQNVKEDQISTVKASNFMNSLSGKVAGVQIKKSNNMGGSTNVVMRGNKSLTNNNQVLYVVDGVPINNEIGSYSSQSTGATGYDYGNAASDVNPDDIESINVLKGSAATALYGSRASGGVIMITTKKGTVGKKGIGVTVNTNIAFKSIDKSTFPTYQQQYGAGYGNFYGPNGDGWFERRDANGVTQSDDSKNFDWVPTTEDGSYGAKFDGHPVYGWYSVDPESPWYKQTKPWEAAKNGPITFFEKPITYTNTVSIDNASDNGTMRMSYTNFKTSDLMPNSDLHKDNFLVNGSWNVTKKLTATATANFTRQAATGRPSTGYSDNIVSNMRQWYQTNMDYADQKTAYFATKRNLTWNYNSALNYPIYTDNPYWQRYENYENDSRNRIVGNMALNYKVTNWLDAYARVSVDDYAEKQEERRAVGSIGTAFGVSRATQKSGYMRRDITFSEYNYDFMLKFNKAINEDFNLSGILGATERRTNLSRLSSSTNGGLSVAGIYSLQNSVSALPFPVEYESKIGVRGLYASVSLGYKNTLFLDGTFRQDHASTLPEGKSTYYYPSITGAFVFSEVVKQNWLSFGKVRLNYAVVGNLAGFDQLLDKYNVNTPFVGASYSLPSTKNNPNLKNESTKSLEGGLEMSFLNKRVGFDLAVYKTNSMDQIMPVTLSQTTGYNFMYVNAGEIENKGIELTLNGSPVRSKNFNWDINVNFATNRNKVVSLYPGIENLQLGSFQGGVTLNATVGEPYGVLKGKDYTYDANGQIIINAKTGIPVKTSTATSNLGNVNPDWTGGITNTFSYKGVSFSFLIDMQKGGSIYSLDMYYGLYTGLYPETVFTNDLGNPVRDPLVGTPGNYAANSGGYIIEGVNVANGVSTPNKTRIDASTSDFGFGTAARPHRDFVYDASFIKLREVSLSYNIPSALLTKLLVKSATVSFVGSNLWIIHKNLPYADPEAGLSAGNIQGYSVGSLPGTRDFGFNLKFNF